MLIKTQIHKFIELSVVIPIYNEEQNIALLYHRLKNVLVTLRKTHEIILVDDGSKDDSLKEMLRLREQDDKVHIIKFRRNFGQTAALDAGFKQAKGNIIITMDGDLQNDPVDIPLLLEKIYTGYDVVSGWRYNRRDNISKRLFSRMAHFLRKFIIKERIHDAGCMLKAYKKECVHNINLYGEMHRYIPALLALKGFKITEVKVQHHKRKYGKTKYNALRLPRGFFDLLFIKFWNDYSTRPLHFFGFMALGQYVLSLLILVEQIIKAIVINSLTAGPLLLLCAILIITGTLTFLFGFLAEIMIRMYYRDNENYSIEKIY